MSKLSKLIKNYEKEFENYNFGGATSQVYSFWYDYVCNVYIEALKSILSDKSPYDEETKNNTKNVFLYIFECGLIILHPLTPFLTEELFQRLPARNSKAPSICVSQYPKDEGYEDPSVEIRAQDILDLTHGVLSVLSQFQILNSKPKINISTTDKDLEKIIEEEKEVVNGLARCSEISLKKKDDKSIEGWLSNVINERIDVFLDIKDKINLDNELKRLNKNLAEKEKYVLNLKKKVENPDYQKRVKEDVQKEDKDKLTKAETEIVKIKESIEKLHKLKK